MKEQEILKVSKTILSLYNRDKPDQIKLENIIEDLRSDYENSKLKAKEEVAGEKELVVAADQTNLVADNSQSSESTNSTSTSKKHEEKNEIIRVQIQPSIPEQQVTHLELPSQDPKMEGRSRSPEERMDTSDNVDYNSGRRSRRTPPRSYVTAPLRERSKSRSRSPYDYYREEREEYREERRPQHGHGSRREKKRDYHREDYRDDHRGEHREHHRVDYREDHRDHRGDYRDDHRGRVSERHSAKHERRHHRSDTDGRKKSGKRVNARDGDYYESRRSRS